MKNGGNNKSVAFYNFVQCIYIYIYIYIKRERDNYAMDYIYNGALHILDCHCNNNSLKIWFT